MEKTVGSFFCGVGGIDWAFSKTSNWQIVFANDFNRYSKSTYDLNFPECPMTLGDVNDIEIERIPNFTFLIGGFPCQAFSVAGEQQGFNDLKGRGKLIYKIVDILKTKKPKGFLLENVSNLVTHDGGSTFTTIQNILKESGYYVDFAVLNASKFGNVPQNRNRVYIIGFKSLTRFQKFRWPKPLKRLCDVSDVIDIESVLDPHYYYTEEKYPKVMEHFSNVPHVVGQVYQYRRNNIRLNKSGLVPTLTANMGLGGHNVPLIYTQNGLRKITPRECFRLQGFPEGYLLPDKIAENHLYQQAGNSVCVRVIERIVEQIDKVF